MKDTFQSSSSLPVSCCARQLWLQPASSQTHCSGLSFPCLLIKNGRGDQNQIQPQGFVGGEEHPVCWVLQAPQKSREEGVLFMQDNVFYLLPGEGRAWSPHTLSAHSLPTCSLREALMENKSPVAQAWEQGSHITGAEWAVLEGLPASRPAVMGPGWEAGAPWTQLLQGLPLSWPPFQLHIGPISEPEWNRRLINNASLGHNFNSWE